MKSLFPYGKICLTSLATEWDISTGLCENWDPKLKRAEPSKVIECLRLLPTDKEQKCTVMDQRCWILSAYHKLQEAKLKLAEKSKLEKDLCDLQGDCPRYNVKTTF